jgi:hypothetical protein
MPYIGILVFQTFVVTIVIENSLKYCDNIQYVWAVKKNLELVLCKVSVAEA